MKLARTLAKTVFTITLIVCMFSTAAARGMSIEVVQPGAVGTDPVDRLPSLEIARPLEIEILDRAPSVDMGFYPFDSDPMRKSLIWNAFPEPLQDEFFERTPSLQLAQPMEDEVVRRTPPHRLAQPMETEAVGKAPSVDMGFYPIDVTAKTPSNAVPRPLEDEAVRRTPSLQLAQPMEDEVVGRIPPHRLAQPMETEAVGKAPSVDMGFYPIDVTARTPSEAVRQPLQDEVFERMPTQAVREPLDIECCGPTMRFDLKEAASAEIAIYSVSGRLVRRLTEALPSGESSLTWDGRDDRGSRAASGVYFARVQANSETAKGKLVLVH